MTESLLSIVFQKKATAIAVFHGLQLEYLHVHHPSATGAKAAQSVYQFLSRTIDAFSCTSAVVELVPSDRTGRALLSEAVLARLRSDAIPVFTFSQADMLSAFSLPPLRTMAELRALGMCLIPMLTDSASHETIDAALIGLLLQVDRELRCIVNSDHSPTSNARTP
jgi:hypothetical protein